MSALFAAYELRVCSVWKTFCRCAPCFLCAIFRRTWMVWSHVCGAFKPVLQVFCCNFKSFADLYKCKRSVKGVSSVGWKVGVEAKVAFIGNWHAVQAVMVGRFAIFSILELTKCAGWCFPLKYFFCYLAFPGLTYYFCWHRPAKRAIQLPSYSFIVRGRCLAALCHIIASSPTDLGASKATRQFFSNAY